MPTVATPASTPPNRPPTITGNPAGSVAQDQPYVFTPSANDADDDTLTFTISNQPSWAAFSSTTGRLSGTPGASHVGGSYNDITISVSDGTATTALPSFRITVAAAPPPPNSPPTITGTPPSSVMTDQAYVFTPSANDADDDRFTFAISNRPSWASFNSSTGRLSGTPRAGDVAIYTNIVIRVSDGEATTSLAPFSIQVVATATGSATLSWTAPTTNADGSTLRDLAGFKIYWGTQRGNYPNSATINNPGVAAYVVDELTPATWYFVATALDSSGNESGHSNEASKTITP
jgi:Putative Ig domain